MSLWSRIKEIAAVADLRKPVLVRAAPSPAPTPPLPPITHPGPVTSPKVMAEPEAFYATLRTTPLQHKATEQVAGTNAILAGMAGQPIAFTAYALATAWHETGEDMQPNVENLNYSVKGLLATFSRSRISRADAEAIGRKEGRPANQRAIGNIIYGGAWGRENLGNTEPNDGFTYRGRGFEHVTGRRNYQRTGAALGIDLLANPDALLDLATAVRSLVSGMTTGRYVPGHNFARHLPINGPATVPQFASARRIINGQDKADLIAGHAQRFQAALIAGGWK
jgi:putative chitinase